MNDDMKIRKDIAVSEAGLVFNPVTGESFSLNPIGLQIIRLITGGNNYQEISSAILEQYQTDRTTFEKDYQDFIALLEQHNLLEND